MLPSLSQQLWGIARLSPAVQHLGRRFFHFGTSPHQAEPAPVPLSKLKDNFNDATSVTYLEELEQRYKQDPGSVDKTWGSFFRSLGAGPPASRGRAAATAAQDLMISPIRRGRRVGRGHR
jgi:hypothetical protein